MGEGALVPLKLFHQGYWSPMLFLVLFGIVLLFKETGWWQTLPHPIVLIWGIFRWFMRPPVIADRYHFPSHPDCDAGIRDDFGCV